MIQASSPTQSCCWLPRIFLVRCCHANYLRKALKSSKQTLNYVYFSVSIETQWSYSLESIGKNLPPLTQLHSTEDFSKRMNPSNTKRSLSGMDASKSQKTFSRRARVMSSQPVQPNTITPNVKSINIRFDTPFHYTTVTWNDGTCQKDLSQFHVLSPSESENQVGHPDKYSMNISAIIGRTPGDSKLEYHLRSISAAPVLKFVIQGYYQILPNVL